MKESCCLKKQKIVELFVKVIFVDYADNYKRKAGSIFLENKIGILRFTLPHKTSKG